MVLKLYGSGGSTCTRRVAVVLAEKQVPFELIAVDYAKGEHKSPPYLEKQPFGQIPYIDDDGFILFESRAIGRYIASKYPDQGTKGLIPTEPKANALFEQAASIELSNFDPFASKAVSEKVFKPMFGQTTDEAVFNEQVKSLEGKLEGYERILSKHKYLAGDELTLADLYHLPYGYVLSVAGGTDVFSKHPNLSRWWKDVSSRPAWQSVKDGAKSTA